MAVQEATSQQAAFQAQLEAALSNQFGVLGFHQIAGTVPTDQLEGDGTWPGALAPDSVGETELTEPDTWLRLATVASRKVSFGKATITGDGSPTKSTTVTHGLNPLTPVLVLATADGTAGSATLNGLCATVKSIGATTFTLAIRDIDGNNFNDPHDVYWLAIG
jgi:hypothetical protein